MSDNSKNVLVNKTKVVFTVNDFDVNQNKIFRSEDFTIGSNVWQITIDTNSMNSAFKEAMFAIKLKSKSENNVFVGFDSFIYDSNMKQIYRRFGQKFFELSPNWCLINGIVSQKRFVAQKDSIFANKTLIIGAIICVVSKDVFECIPRIISHRKTFNIKQFNDLNIICGDKEFFVSKSILTSHSIVFQKMFSNEMREQNTNQLIIEDIDGEVFEEFLKFIYFGNSDKLEELKEDLLIIADRYQVLSLKEICSAFMLSEICDTNAIQLLIAFDKYNCVETCVENPIIEFIAKNLYEIKRKTPNQWKELKERHIQLLDRIIERMAQLIKEELKDDKEINNSTNAYTLIF